MRSPAGWTSDNGLWPPQASPSIIPTFFIFAPHPAPAPLQTKASKQLLIVPLLKTSLHQDVLALSLIPPIFSMHVYIVTRIFSIIVWRLQILTVI